MRKVLVASVITALLLTACAAPQGKTTVIQDVLSPEPTEFVLNVLTPDIPKETPTVEVSVEEEQESSVSPLLVAHMVKNDLPEATAERYASYIMEASDETSIDPFTILSVMHVETGGTFRFKNYPNSHGAVGLMQVRGITAEYLGVAESSLYDPETNIQTGTRYLKYLQDRFGHDLGITAYNQGEGNLERGTYNLKYFYAVQKVFSEIEGNDCSKKSSPHN